MTSAEFIFEYFKADQDTGAGSYEKMISITNTLNWEEIKPYILSEKYFYFLKSAYWRIISEEIKRRAGRKCFCGCRENLQTHHLSYDHHGEEHLYMDNLQVLCSKCHQGGAHKENVSVKIAEKKRRRDNKKENILAQIPISPLRVSESNITGSSFGLTRKLLEEMESERQIWIDRPLYDEWQIHQI